MPRANRLPSLRSACYYYRRRSARARPIIKDHGELEILRELLAVALKRSGARLYAFHIDSTQLHLVVRAGDRQLIPALSAFCHELAHRMNERRGESGSLFAQRARMTVFQPEVWLLPIVRYVHSICALPDPLLSWNSDTVYRTRRRMIGLTTSAVTRALASRSDLSSALDTYQAYFDAPAAPGEVALIEHGSREDIRILGHQTFMTRMIRARVFAERHRAPEKNSPDEVIQHATELIIDRFHTLCRRYMSERDARDWITKTTVGQLRSKSRRTPLPLVRAMIADYALAQRLARLREIESYFGLQAKSLAAGLRRRYNSKMLARFSGGSGTARHRIPDFQRSTQ